MNVSHDELYSTAIHEAAHFVTQIMGYADVPTGSIPDKISIVADDDRFGYVRDPAFSLVLLTPELYTRDQKVREVVKYLAGYAAESILTGEPFEEIEIAGDRHNFLKATDIIMGLVIDQPEHELLTGIIFYVLCDHTKDFLQTPVVWSAVQLVANRLMIQPEIDRSNGLFDLIEEVFRIPGFEQIRLITPSIT